MLQEFTDTAIDFTETEDDAGAADETVDESSAPVVRLVHLMISAKRSSFGRGYPRRAVRRPRADPLPDRRGLRRARQRPPAGCWGLSLSRIKILSKIDIAERRRPQDGRIKITVGDKELDLRVSVIPTNHGQSVVMRLLDQGQHSGGSAPARLLARNDFRKFNGLIRRPNGIILVTGSDRLGQDDHAVRRAE